MDLKPGEGADPLLGDSLEHLRDTQGTRLETLAKESLLLENRFSVAEAQALGCDGVE